MIQVVIARSIQGILSGIGIGTIFFCYPIVKHLVSEKYRIKFKIEGYLEEFALTNNEADDLIINARNVVFK